MQAFLMVFIGGGLGSMCRYGIAKLLQAQDLNFPWATFLANALACIVLGVLISMSAKDGLLSNSMKLLLLTGFCGGFSTFSTFSAETFGLLETGNYFYAFANIALSVLVCLACIFIGLMLGRG